MSSNKATIMQYQDQPKSEFKEMYEAHGFGAHTHYSSGNDSSTDEDFKDFDDMYHALKPTTIRPNDLLLETENKVDEVKDIQKTLIDDTMNLFVSKPIVPQVTPVQKKKKKAAQKKVEPKPNINSLAEFPSLNQLEDWDHEANNEPCDDINVSSLLEETFRNTMSLRQFIEHQSNANSVIEEQLEDWDHEVNNEPCDDINVSSVLEGTLGTPKKKKKKKSKKKKKKAVEVPQIVPVFETTSSEILKIMSSEEQMLDPVIQDDQSKQSQTLEDVVEISKNKSKKKSKSALVESANPDKSSVDDKIITNKKSTDSSNVPKPLKSVKNKFEFNELEISSSTDSGIVNVSEKDSSSIKSCENDEDVDSAVYKNYLTIDNFVKLETDSTQDYSHYINSTKTKNIEEYKKEITSSQTRADLTLTNETVNKPENASAKIESKAEKKKNKKLATLPKNETMESKIEKKKNTKLATLPKNETMESKIVTNNIVEGPIEKVLIVKEETNVKQTASVPNSADSKTLNRNHSATQNSEKKIPKSKKTVNLSADKVDCDETIDIWVQIPPWYDGDRNRFFQDMVKLSIVDVIEKKRMGIEVINPVQNLLEVHNDNATLSRETRKKLFKMAKAASKETLSTNTDDPNVMNKSDSGKHDNIQYPKTNKKTISEAVICEDKSVSPADAEEKSNNDLKLLARKISNLEDRLKLSEELNSVALGGCYDQIRHSNEEVQSLRICLEISNREGMQKILKKMDDDRDSTFLEKLILFGATRYFTKHLFGDTISMGLAILVLHFGPKVMRLF